jgi:hypothetical protein
MHVVETAQLRSLAIRSGAMNLCGGFWSEWAFGLIKNILFVALVTCFGFQVGEQMRQYFLGRTVVSSFTVKNDQFWMPLVTLCPGFRLGSSYAKGLLEGFVRFSASDALGRSTFDALGRRSTRVEQLSGFRRKKQRPTT